METQHMRPGYTRCALRQSDACTDLHLRQADSVDWYAYLRIDVLDNPKLWKASFYTPLYVSVSLPLGGMG
jgi:hypothetical protein